MNLRVKVFVCLLFSLAACSRETFQQGEISSGEVSTIESIFNVHGSSIKYLKISGQMFKRVRGSPPHFQSIPNSDLILFVTADENQRVLFRVTDLKTHEVFTIDGHSSLYGSYIGTPLNSGNQFGDWIESYTPPRLVLKEKTVSGETVTTLNLATLTMESEIVTRK